MFDDPVANQTARGMLLAALEAMRGNTSNGLDSLQDIMRPLKSVSFAPTIPNVQLAEAVR